MVTLARHSTVFATLLLAILCLTGCGGAGDVVMPTENDLAPANPADRVGRGPRDGEHPTGTGREPDHRPLSGDS